MPPPPPTARIQCPLAFRTIRNQTTSPPHTHLGHSLPTVTPGQSAAGEAGLCGGEMGLPFT